MDHNEVFLLTAEASASALSPTASEVIEADLDLVAAAASAAASAAAAISAFFRALTISMY
jgi:hypothetical protein